MEIWLFVCALGTVAVIPLHFLSVEHVELVEEYGRERGVRIGEVLGLVSGWGFFIFWAGTWISSQPRFSIFSSLSVSIPTTDFSVPLLHLAVSLPLLILGAWLGIQGVREVRAFSRAQFPTYFPTY